MIHQIRQTFPRQIFPLYSYSIPDEEISSINLQDASLWWRIHNHVVLAFNNFLGGWLIG